MDEDSLETLYRQLRLDVVNFTSMWEQLRGCEVGRLLECECETVTREKQNQILDILRCIMDTGSTRSQVDEEGSHLEQPP